MSSKKAAPQRPTEAPAPPPPPREVVRELTPVQARTVMALVAQRDQIVVEGNRRLAEINESILELARLFGFPSGAPAGEGEGGFDFEQRGEQIVVVKVG